MNKKKAREKLLGYVIKRNNGCWEWQRGKSNGYGMVSIEGKLWWTHRLSYLLFKGTLSEGKCVCHSCDNPCCCNPDHLFLGTTQDNTKDRHDKKRDAHGQRNGNAKLSDKQVRRIRKEYDASRGSLRRLADKYGVSIDQIRNVVRGYQRMTGVANQDWNTNKQTLRKDLTGSVFGMLQVITSAGVRGRDACSLCRCECGNEKVVRNAALKAGQTRSCGCLARMTASKLCKERPPRLGTGR